MPSNANVRALQAAQPRAHNSAADEPASRHTFGQRIHTSMQNSLLAPRRRTRHLPINIHGRATCGREAGAEGSMGRKGVWGGREAGAEHPRHTNLHLHTQATTFLSAPQGNGEVPLHSLVPGGIYLIETFCSKASIPPNLFSNNQFSVRINAKGFAGA